MSGSAHAFVKSARRHMAEASTHLGLAVAALQSIDGAEAESFAPLEHLIASMTAQKHLVANHVDLIESLEMLDLELAASRR